MRSWIAVAGQLLTILFVEYALGFHLPLLPMLLVIVSAQTVLKSRAPQAATVVVDRRSGKIKQVLEGQLLKPAEDAEHSALEGAKEVEWIVLPESKVLMPGLVE